MKTDLTHQLKVLHGQVFTEKIVLKGIWPLAMKSFLEKIWQMTIKNVLNGGVLKEKVLHGIPYMIPK